MSPHLTLPGARVDLVWGRVERSEGTSSQLSPLELDLLAYLLARVGQPVSRQDLLEAVWGYTPTVVSRACDTAVRRLRAKIEADPSAPEVLITRYGSGYQLILGPPGPTSDPSPPPATPERRISLGARVVDLGRARVDLGGGWFPLSRNELAVLEVLYAAGGHTVDRHVLQRRVWGSALGRPLENTIGRLRRKLEPNPRVPEHLVTTAVGYRLALRPS